MARTRPVYPDPIKRAELERISVLTEKEQLLVFIDTWLALRAGLIEKHEQADRRWRSHGIFSHGFKVQQYTWEYKMLLTLQKLVEGMPPTPHRHHPDCVAAYCDGRCGREGPCYVDVATLRAAAPRDKQ